ncbi:hypothetical protein M3P05_00100 [Sansalvadorimonas sp. 2012CJ34-2]|uniref:Uncharacterized protein n=1 Tax=Parendozoicomonas callyspongiae TaxID=2942213 RepID=A0ABT0PAG7_9GAMM|nr:hypothetical protein [Sansalvadorimonas sp. 2012CJ34-2]MCL6268349.1 hypothetical protein [Sansalvadorimonas sp. 2012CJ34-2]
MFRKHIKSFTTGFVALVLAGSVSASPIAPDASGMQRVIHKGGSVITGNYIAPVNDKVEGSVSVYNLFSLETESCGILDFQAGMIGVICTNCQQNTAVLKGCTIPRTNIGWKLSNG